MATSKVSRTFGWILMALVMVGLVGFGATNFGGSVSSIGKVGNTEIDAGTYARQLQSELRAFEAQTGTPMTLAQAQNFGLDQQVLNRVISAAAMEDETMRLGISVGDDTLRDRITEISSFTGVDGKFDPEGYKFALEQSGLTASEFEKSLRAEVSSQILQEAVTGGIHAQSGYVDAIYGYARETRDFTWGSIGADQLVAPLPAPTETALTAYYEANPEEFTLPETKVISYAWLNPEDVIPSINIDDAQIRALYDERIDEYEIPEKRMVERLVFGTEDDAQAAIDAINGGDKTFEDLVADRNLQLSDVDLGDVSKAELGEAGDAVFALDLDSDEFIAGPFESDLGPAIFRANGVIYARSTSFDDAKKELHGELAADAARRQISDMVAELDDAMAGGATLEEISESHNMRLETINWTDGASDGIAAYEAFRDAATAVTADDFPEITLMADGGVFAMRLDELQEPRLQEQSDVADAVREGWAAQKSRELLKEKAESMIPELEGGESLASLGLTEIVEQDQARDAFVEGTPASFMTDVFKMTPGTWKVLENGDGMVLVRLDVVSLPDQNSDEAKTLKDSFSQQTAQEIALDAQAAFAQAIQNRAGVELNRNVINAVHAQFP